MKDAEAFVTGLAEHGLLLVSDQPFTQEKRLSAEAK
jgi:hypothetical protein